MDCDLFDNIKRQHNIDIEIAVLVLTSGE